MQKKLSLGLLFGLIGNALFILFAIMAYWYYLIFDPYSTFCKVLEHTTYAVLFSGFIALAVSDVLLCITVRMRLHFKIAYTVYILMEALVMYCELNMYKVMEYYDPYSLKLMMLHALISAVVCFTFVYLDPYKTPYEVAVILCIGVILGGMFGNIIGIRLYFSVLANAIAYTGLFAAIIRMRKREIIEIDCYGDSAHVAEYKSVVYEEETDDDAAEDAEGSESETDKPDEKEVK